LINTIMIQKDKTRYAEYILIKAGTKWLKTNLVI
jgi:hypothetical protein